MEWETIVAAVGGALIGAALGGFFRDWIAEKYFRPKLYILDESVIPSLGGEVHRRIMIANKGKRAAQNCIGMITLDATEDDVWEPPHRDFVVQDEPRPDLWKGHFRKIEGMSLCWSRAGNPEAIVINRETSQALEFYIAHFGSHITIPSEEGWNPYRVHLKGKEYLGKICVTSANADPAWASFRLIPEVDDVKLEITERKPSWEEHK